MPPSTETRHRPPTDLSSAAQEYLLGLRIMAGDGSRITASQVARRLGVSTQAASEMFRRLANDGLVILAEGRELHLTTAGRTAADGIFRRHALCEWLLSEIVDMADFFFTDREREEDDSAALLGKRYAGDPAAAAEALAAVIDRIEGVEPWEHDAMEAAIRPMAEELEVKAGDLFGLIRVAVTGKTAAPPLFETLEVLGRQRTIDRLRAAKDRLAAVA